MFLRLLVIIVVVGLLVGGWIGVMLRTLPPAPGNASTVQPTVAEVRIYTGDQGPRSGSGAGSPDVQAQPGNPVKIAFSEQTTILKPAAGTIADLKIGDTITVQGQADTDGTVLAKAVTVSATPDGLGSQPAQPGRSQPQHTPQAGQGGTPGQPGGQTGLQGFRPLLGIIDTVEGSTFMINPITTQQPVQAGSQGGPQGARGTFGQIESIEGNLITVNSRTNNVNVLVQVDQATIYIKYEVGTAANLTPGTNVNVTGQPGTDGTVSAINIVITTSTR